MFLFDRGLLDWIRLNWLFMMLTYDFICLTLLNFCYFFSTPSPWYNRTGWLGVKHQVTYLLTLAHLKPRFPAPLLQTVQQWKQTWNRTMPRALVQNQHKRELISARDVTQTQQRPESPSVTITLHARTYKVHKRHQRYILSFCGPRFVSDLCNTSFWSLPHIEGLRWKALIHIFLRIPLYFYHLSCLERSH